MSTAVSFMTSLKLLNNLLLRNYTENHKNYTENHREDTENHREDALTQIKFIST